MGNTFLSSKTIRRKSRVKQASCLFRFLQSDKKTKACFFREWDVSGHILFNMLLDS